MFDVALNCFLLQAQRPNMVETKAELQLVYAAALAYYNCKERDL